MDGEDANGVVSSGYYNDPLDRPTEVVRAINTPVKCLTSFSYDDTLRIITSTSDQNTYGDNLLKSETLYDGLGRTTETRQYETGSAYITTKQSFDALGRVSQTSNQYRAGESVLWTTTQYDVLGRATSVTTPDSAAVTTSYSGNQVTVVDQAGKDRQSKTDALGRLLEVIEDPGTGGLNYQTTYGYDVLDNLTTVTQGSQTRSFSYDSLKRLTSATNPESGAISYQYDTNGNLTQKTDARGVMTTYSYDELNRVKTRSYSDGITPTVTYTYDALGIAYSKGKLTSVSSSVSTTSYTGFDAMGRVTSHQQETSGVALPYQMSYAYNLSGALTSETYPSGRTITTGYDGAGRINAVSGQKTGETNKTYASQIDYASHGAVKSITLGNSLIEQTAFNSRLQPLMIKLATASNQSVEEMHYYYGGAENNGNVLHHTTVVDGISRQQVYEYDQLNRLKKGNEQGGSNWQQEFTYDRYGNRNFDVGQTTPAMLGSNLSVDPINNRYTLGQGSIQYDLEGNVTRDFDGHIYAYDAENKQNNYDNGQATYSYDGDGRRVKKVAGNNTTIFVYDVNGQLVAEYSTSTPEPGSGGTSYLTSDMLGTPRVITDANGAVKSRHDYLPFGEEISVGVGGRTGQTNPATGGVGQKYVYGIANDSVRQKFTGKEHDIETGLDYFNARYYASMQGRFTSPDPLLSSGIIHTPQSWNRYSYALNNPLKYTDPTGMYVWDTSLGGSAEDKDVSGEIRSKRQEFRSAREQTIDAVFSNDLSPDQKDELARSIHAYGNEGEDNGVTVGMGKTDKDEKGRTGWGKDGNKLQALTTKNGNYVANVMITISSNASQVFSSDVFAHEGSHAADRQDFANAAVKAMLSTGISDAALMQLPENITSYASELRAFKAGSSMDQFARRNSEVWNSGWNEADRLTHIKTHIQTYYKFNEQKQGDLIYRVSK